ncbi:MAG: Flp family type IVb pilin [Alphaproteobacteria bacterium]|nr:Flp family type IVb pilin [Alphaproteobacteria bacterium]
MKAVWRKFTGLASDRRGATAIEYGLIMALMTLALVGALSTTGSNTQDKWDGVANSIGTSMDNAGA